MFIPNFTHLIEISLTFLESNSVFSLHSVLDNDSFICCVEQRIGMTPSHLVIECQRF